MRAKQFFYAAAGILLLVTAYTVGARQADAQTSGQQAVSITYAAQGAPRVLVIASNGDVYSSFIDNTGAIASWAYVNNVFGMVPVQATTISSVKQEYRK